MSGIIGVVCFIGLMWYVVGIIIIVNKEKKKKAIAEKKKLLEDADWVRNNKGSVSDYLEEINEYEIKEEKKNHKVSCGPQAKILNYSAGTTTETLNIVGNAYYASSYTTHGWTNSSDSYGNWSVKYDIWNCGNKTIKRAHVTFYSINKIYEPGDKVRVSYTGFIGPNDTAKDLICSNIWHDPYLSMIKVLKIELEFTDGTQQEIFGDKVTNIGFDAYEPDKIEEKVRKRNNSLVLPDSQKKLENADESVNDKVLTDDSNDNSSSIREVEEGYEYDVVLKFVGNEKIKVIRTIKEMAGIGIAEAKEIVDNVPSTVLEGVSEYVAEKTVKMLKEVGAYGEAIKR